jgi:hypothetical protein
VRTTVLFQHALSAHAARVATHLHHQQTECSLIDVCRYAFESRLNPFRSLSDQTALVMFGAMRNWPAIKNGMNPRSGKFLELWETIVMRHFYHTAYIFLLSGVYTKNTRVLMSTIALETSNLLVLVMLMNVGPAHHLLTREDVFSVYTRLVDVAGEEILEQQAIIWLAGFWPCEAVDPSPEEYFAGVSAHWVALDAAEAAETDNIYDEENEIEMGNPLSDE